jgi:AraC-like DNA-binding protein
MFYRRYTPPPPLATLVGCLWYSEGLEGAHERERLLPNGESGIVFDLREEPVRDYSPANRAGAGARFETSAPAIFCGARTDCFVIDTSRQQRVVGIQFRPGGAFAFLGMPAGEVANDTYSLEDIWPGQALRLREALMDAPSVGAMFSMLERALTARLGQSSDKRPSSGRYSDGRYSGGPNSALHPAVAYALDRLASPAEGVRVRDITDRIGLSSRRFIELFRDQTGLTPKAFHRVRRFQQVLQALHRRVPADGDLTAVAYHCGYYDQPHFIHDFRLFSGMTPGEYLAVATPHLNHVPLH